MIWWNSCIIIRPLLKSNDFLTIWATFFWFTWSAVLLAVLDWLNIQIIQTQSIHYESSVELLSFIIIIIIIIIIGMQVIKI